MKKSPHHICTLASLRDPAPAGPLKLLSGELRPAEN